MRLKRKSQVSPQEHQAREVVLHYKTLMSRPAVQAITWWDITDGGWLKAPAGLLREDQTPKPAYEALLNLVKGEWWLKPTRMVTDEHGSLSFSGFAGEYELSVDDQKISFLLEKNEETSIPLEI